MNSQLTNCSPASSFSLGEKVKDEGQTGNSVALRPANPWPERRTELREREWRIYVKLITKCELAIDSLMAEPRHTISAKELTALLDLAERIGRLAAGLPKENAAQDIDGEDDRSLRLEVAAAIKKIYSQPIETLAVRMARVSAPIELEPPNGN